jgi:beta-lactamase superfamily II metal-dependent hydrolase
MALRYISERRTVFHPDSRTGTQEFVLIYGDQVDTTDTDPENGRTEVTYRRRVGWVRTDHLTQHHPCEMYFIDVGQGDSTFVVTPQNRKILVDGGTGNEAFQFLVWRYRLDLPNPQPVDIDLLVLSHADGDHIGGLMHIIQHQHINVRRIIHSGIANFREGIFDTRLGDTEGQGQQRRLVTRHNHIDELIRGELEQDHMQPWFDAVTAEQADTGMQYGAVDSTTGIIDIGDPDVGLTVLGPRLLPHNGGRAFDWFGGDAKTINGNSVVLRLDIDNVGVLLAGDLNKTSERFLMQDAAFVQAIDAHILKSPHHGSHDFYTPFLRAINPQVTVISSGETPDHGHPRANYVGAVGKASRSDEPLVFSTELAALFAVDADAEAPDADDPADPTNAALLGQARRRFKKRLNGLINVRTDGSQIYAARRVAAGYQFVAYGPIPLANRTPEP